MMMLPASSSGSNSHPPLHPSGGSHVQQPDEPSTLLSTSSVMSSNVCVNDDWLCLFQWLLNHPADQIREVMVAKFRAEVLVITEESSSSSNKNDTTSSSTKVLIQRLEAVTTQVMEAAFEFITDHIDNETIKEHVIQILLLDCLDLYTIASILTTRMMTKQELRPDHDGVIDDISLYCFYIQIIDAFSGFYDEFFHRMDLVQLVNTLILVMKHPLLLQKKKNINIYGQVIDILIRRVVEIDGHSCEMAVVDCVLTTMRTHSSHVIVVSRGCDLLSRLYNNPVVRCPDTIRLLAQLVQTHSEVELIKKSVLWTLIRIPLVVNNNDHNNDDELVQVYESEECMAGLFCAAKFILEEFYSLPLRSRMYHINILRMLIQRLSLLYLDDIVSEYIVRYDGIPIIIQYLLSTTDKTENRIGSNFLMQLAQVNPMVKKKIMEELVNCLIYDPSHFEFLLPLINLLQSLLVSDITVFQSTIASIYDGIQKLVTCAFVISWGLLVKPQIRYHTTAHLDLLQKISSTQCQHSGMLPIHAVLTAKLTLFLALWTHEKDHVIIHQAQMQLVHHLMLAYPKGIQMKDRNGRCPLHVSIDNHADSSVIGAIVKFCPSIVTVPCLSLDEFYDLPAALRAATQSCHVETIYILLREESTFVGHSHSSSCSIKLTNKKKKETN